MNNSRLFVLLIAPLIYFCDGLAMQAKAQMTQVRKSGADLTAYVGPLPQSIDPSSVTSFTEYVLIQQLTRGLVKYDSFGQLTGDVATEWRISAESKTFQFKLNPDTRFSDGARVTAKDVVGSINRQMLRGQTIHYNFSDVASVKELGELELEITLKQSDHLFITKLTLPEFGILHSSDYTKPLTKTCEWKVTSGHFALINMDSKAVQLKQNKGLDRTLKLVGSLQEKGKSEVKGIDFFVGLPPLSTSDHEKVSVDYDAYSPRLAFTYFLSFGRSSRLLKDPSLREAFLAKLYDFRRKMQLTSPFHTQATQLYLDDGPGRTKKERLREIEKRHQSKSHVKVNGLELNLLVQKAFPYSSALTDFLKSIGIVPKVHFYANFDEFDRIRNSKEIDVIQSNNDFSAADLTANIMVTLNPLRPLIETTGSTDVRVFLESLTNESEETKRISAIQKIEESLLEQGFVFPLFHYNMYFYVDRSRDSSQMSRKFPEVALWKIL